MKMLTSLALIVISGTHAQPGAGKPTAAGTSSAGPSRAQAQVAALSDRIDKLEGMLGLQLQELHVHDKLEYMLESQLKEKLDNMLEERMTTYLHKAEAYANEAVRVARKELIKSERLIVKVADDNAEYRTSKLTGLETKFASEVEAVEGTASEHRRSVEERMAATPSKQVVEDVAERVRRLETNATAEFKFLHKKMKDSDDVLSTVDTSHANKTEETVKNHKTLEDSHKALLTQFRAFEREMRTNVNITLNAQTFAPERRAQVYTNIVADSAITTGAGCATVDLSGAAKNVDLSSATQCNGMVCPSCWIVAVAHGTNSLNLQGCSRAHLSAQVQLGVTTGFTAATRSYTIINADESTAAKICDGTGPPNCALVGPKSVVELVCYTGPTTTHIMYWPSNYFANLEVAGAAVVGTTLQVDSTSTFNGAVNLGNEKVDTITFFGDIAIGSTNPDFDWATSGSCTAAGPCR